MTIENEEQFQTEKAQLIAQAEAATKRYEETQAQTQELILNTQFDAAFKELGGIGSDTDRDAYDAIMRQLKSNMKFEKGQPVFVDEFGDIEQGQYGPKTVREKLAEVKQTSAYKPFFSCDAGTQADQASGPKTYKLEDARNGKASIEDIASGKIQAEGVDSARKPDTKRVSPEQIAKFKPRTWK